MRKAQRSIIGKGMGIRVKKYTVMIYMIAKRLLCRKSFWVCLAAIPILAGVLQLLERETETVIYAAIYTPEEEIWRPVFAEKEGVVQFYFCGSEEELARDIIRGNAECGYVLQEDLQKRFREADWNWAVTVYQSPDTIMAEVLNETVFGRIFHKISLNWYEGYIANLPALTQADKDKAREEAVQLFSQNINDGSTFQMEVQYVSDEGHEGTETESVRSIFPMKGIVFTGMLLCGLLGSMQAVSDREERLFLYRSPGMAALINVSVPSILAMAAGFAALSCKVEEIPYLGSLVILVILCGLVLQWVIRTKEVFAACMPFLVFGSLAGSYFLSNACNLL